MTYRKITEGDAGSISRLSSQLGYSIDTANTLLNISEIISNPHHCAFVSEQNSEITGWIHGFYALKLESLPFVEISGLVVDQTIRNSGTGKKLIACVEVWAREKKVKTIRIRCNMVRKETHQFYTHLGFTETKQQKIFERELS